MPRSRSRWRRISAPGTSVFPSSRGWTRATPVTSCANGARRFYLASTVWVYNGAPANGHAVDETTPFYLHGAGHIYTSTKMASEMVCHNYGELYGVPFTVLRYGIPYGPRMREEMLIP